jgi:2-dehydropantoate 2-reductase
VSRFIVYGAGAVGGTIGARLFQSDYDVTLIARGEHGRRIAADGLRFRTPEANVTLRIPVVAHPKEIAFREDDRVILAVQSQNAGDALHALAAVAPEAIHLVCAQNGVENERAALRLFANVHGMCVLMPTTHLKPAEILSYGSPRSGSLTIGRFPYGSDAVDREIAGALEASRINCEVADDVMAHKYAKLLLNVHNSLEAACGTEARTSALGDDARREATACFEAAGICYVPKPREGRQGRVPVMDIPGEERAGGSMWQSVARAAEAVEADYLNGEIVMLGRLYGIPTPVNEMLRALGHRMLRERIPAGSLDLSALSREARL